MVAFIVFGGFWHLHRIWQRYAPVPTLAKYVFAAIVRRTYSYVIILFYHIYLSLSVGSERFLDRNIIDKQNLK